MNNTRVIRTKSYCVHMGLFSRTDLPPFRKSEGLVNFSLIDLCIV